MNAFPGAFPHCASCSKIQPQQAIINGMCEGSSIRKWRICGGVTGEEDAPVTCPHASVATMIIAKPFNLE